MSIQYFEHPLAQGIRQAGSSLAGAIGQYGDRAYEKQQKQASYKREEDVAQAQRIRQGKTAGLIRQGMAKLGPEATTLGRIGVLENVLEETGDLETIKEYSTMSAALQKATSSGGSFEGKSESELTTLFQQFGMDDATSKRFAALYPTLSTGGKTSFFNYFMDQLQRGAQGGALFGDAAQPARGVQFGDETPSGDKTDPLSPQANVEPGQPEKEEKFTFPEVNPFQRLTSQDIVKRESELSKDNVPIFNAATKTVKASKIAGRTIRRLNQLNESGKLPSGIGKIVNVNYKTGDLRIPSGANKETQLFVKTVNEFLKGAKEIFGARVTNFELDRFMQGLPTLANTEEGRRVILRQMDIVNQMHQLENNSLKEVYDHYTLRRIDVQQAQQIADKLMAPEEARLNEAFDRVLEEGDIQEAIASTPKGEIAIEINGQRGYVPKSQEQMVKERGGKIL